MLWESQCSRSIYWTLPEADLDNICCGRTVVNRKQIGLGQSAYLRYHDGLSFGSRIEISGCITGADFQGRTRQRHGGRGNGA
jgi:hypothetical protein